MRIYFMGKTKRIFKKSIIITSCFALATGILPVLPAKNVQAGTIQHPLHGSFNMDSFLESLYSDDDSWDDDMLDMDYNSQDTWEPGTDSSIWDDSTDYDGDDGWDDPGWDDYTPSPSPIPSGPLFTPDPDATFLFNDTIYDKMYFQTGDKGLFDVDYTDYDLIPYSYQERLSYITYQSSNDAVMQTSSSGSYHAVSPGRVVITITGYDSESSWIFERSFELIVQPDMDKVSFSKNSVTLYTSDYSYEPCTANIKIKSPYILDEDDDLISITADSSNSSMYASYTIKNNVLQLSSTSPGRTTIKFTINGKVFTVKLTVISLKISAASLLLTNGQTKQLKVRGYKGKVKFRSSRPRKVSVNSKGKVKAKKRGNAFITAKIGNIKLGCVVSVITPQKKKVISRARKIVKSSVYSQANRMQKGYYDCSSLVWRSYLPYGYDFGNGSYAPVAADQAKWLAGRNKLLKGGYSEKNVQSMKLEPGDLLFETGEKNGRYKGIYHVEMFAGYNLYGFDSKGKPLVISKWVNRPDGSYMYGCGIVGKM